MHKLKNLEILDSSLVVLKLDRKKDALVSYLGSCVVDRDWHRVNEVSVQLIEVTAEIKFWKQFVDKGSLLPDMAN